MQALTKNEFHPIYNPSEFRIETPMMRALVEVIHQWVWTGVTGGLVLGDNRAGKTTAVTEAIILLMNRMGEPIAAKFVSIPRRDQSSVAAVYRYICFALGLRIKSRQTADQMSDAVCFHLHELANENLTKQVVLFVDEFQRLSLKQLEAFAEIHDRLSLAKVNVCIIFTGNKASADPLLRRAKNEQHELIRGRFFSQYVEYFGIRNRQELKFCLSQYDTLRYPLRSGLTYTSYFSPNKKFKLASLTDSIWDEYSENYRLKYDLASWPMQYFTSTVRNLLADYIFRFGVEPDVLKEAIHLSMEASGIAGAATVA